jgi:hypothetical protein
MGKALAVASLVVGILSGLLSVSFWLALAFNLFNTDYEGGLGGWLARALLTLVFSIICFVVAKRLWRIDEE